MVGYSDILKKASGKRFIILALILVIALLLRIFAIDFKSPWLDELYSIVPTNPANTVAFIVDYCKSDQPPFYFLTLHYWFKVTPYTVASARILSAIIGLLGVTSLFFLGREIKNTSVGLIASFLTAINYFHIFYSQEARFYSLLFLFTSLSFIWFIRSIKYKNLPNYILYVVSTVALLYTQYYGIIIFAIQGLLFILYVIFFRASTRFIVTGVVMALLIAVAFTPWIPTILKDSTIDSYWIEKPKPYFFAVYYYLYMGKDVFAGLLMVVLCLPLSLEILTQLKKRQMSLELFLVVLVIIWALLSLFLPYVRSVTSTPILQPRYTIVTLPAIILLISVAIERLSVKRQLAVLSVLTVSFAINIFGVSKHYTKIDKAQWREAAAVVIEKNNGATKVYSNQEWWYNYFFYFVNPPIKVLGQYSVNEAKELPVFIEQVGNENELWVLSGEGMTGLNKLQQEYVDQHFTVKEKYIYFGASAVLYTKREAKGGRRAE
jgi:mannosyltransferase